MEDSYNDLENNRRLAVIEQSITRTLLYDDDKKNMDKCYGLSCIPICIGIFAIIIVMVVVIITLKSVG